MRLGHSNRGVVIVRYTSGAVEFEDHISVVIDAVDSSVRGLASLCIGGEATAVAVELMD